MPRVLIAGGGISGRTIAYRLQQQLPTAEIVVWEAGDRLGGNVWTERIDYFVIEHGPNGFLDGKISMLELAKVLGLGDRLIPANILARQHRYLYVDGTLREMPNGLRSLLKTSLLSVRGKLRLLAELFIRRGNLQSESVAAFATRRFGPEVAEVFIDALVTGIYGGDPALLDIRAAFPRMSSFETRHGSVVRGFLSTRGKPQNMWSFRGGLRELVDALTLKLIRKPALGMNLRRLEPSNSRWIAIGPGTERDLADPVVLACPAFAQAEIIDTFDTRLAASIGAIAYNRIAVVAFSVRETEVPRKANGFGFIAPQRSRRDLLGLQWCSAIYPDRAPPGLVLWRALCGGWHRGDVVDWADDRLVNAVRAELRLAQGVSAVPIFTRVIRWQRAIPQYTQGHPERIAQIEINAAGYPGLFLTGNAYRGVALNDCVEEAGQMARRVVAYLGDKMNR